MVDAQVHRREAENEVTQLRRGLSKARQAVIEVDQATQLQENLHCDALLTLERVPTEDPPAANQADQALIQSLEKQLNDANQQLRQLRAERVPIAADGQMAVH